MKVIKSIAGFMTAALLLFFTISCVNYDVKGVEPSVLLVQMDGEIEAVTYDAVVISSEDVARLDGKVCEDLNKIAAANNDTETQNVFISNKLLMLPVSKNLSLASGSILQLKIVPRETGTLSIRISDENSVLKDYEFKGEKDVPLTVVYEYRMSK